jgi:hypothetical protein
VKLSVAREDQAFLNVTRVGGDAYVRHPQKPVHRHPINLQAVALSKSRARDEALECRMDRLLPVEAESSRPDPARHIKECPSCGREFVFKLVRIENALDRHPGTRIRLVFDAERLREESTPFDQNGSGGDQQFNLST